MIVCLRILEPCIRTLPVSYTIFNQSRESSLITLSIPCTPLGPKHALRDFSVILAICSDLTNMAFSYAHVHPRYRGNGYSQTYQGLQTFRTGEFTESLSESGIVQRQLSCLNMKVKSSALEAGSCRWLAFVERDRGFHPMQLESSSKDETCGSPSNDSNA